MKEKMLYPRFRSGFCLQQAKHKRQDIPLQSHTVQLLLEDLAVVPGMFGYGSSQFEGIVIFYTFRPRSHLNLNQQHFIAKSFYFNEMLNEFSLENFLNKTACFNVFSHKILDCSLPKCAGLSCSSQASPGLSWPTTRCTRWPAGWRSPSVRRMTVSPSSAS